MSWGERLHLSKQKNTGGQHLLLGSLSATVRKLRIRNLCSRASWSPGAIARCAVAGQSPLPGRRLQRWPLRLRRIPTAAELRGEGWGSEASFPTDVKRVPQSVCSGLLAVPELRWLPEGLLEIK